MESIKFGIVPVCDDPPKARLPRKLKKDIKKVAGEESYIIIISNIQGYYNAYGYQKFNIKRGRNGRN